MASGKAGETHAVTLTTERETLSVMLVASGKAGCPCRRVEWHGKVGGTGAVLRSIAISSSSFCGSAIWWQERKREDIGVYQLGIKLSDPKFQHFREEQHLIGKLPLSPLPRPQNNDDDDADRVGDEGNGVHRVLQGSRWPPPVPYYQCNLGLLAIATPCVPYHPHQHHGLRIQTNALERPELSAYKVAASLLPTWPAQLNQRDGENSNVLGERW